MSYLPDPIRWVAALDGTQIVAVQHECADGMPVNCYLDEHNNWTCPNCGAIYGAAIPLAGWGAFGLKPACGETTERPFPTMGTP